MNNGSSRTAAACLWGGGFIVGSLGIHFHQLWLVYLGYGILGGCGLGLGYVSPVSTLIRWFPDRRGMATGMAIMGFGGGAMIGTPLKEFLLRTFWESPQYLGTVESVSLITERGRRFAEVSGQTVEVVVAGAMEAGREGVYVGRNRRHRRVEYLPDIATPAFAATYVFMISVFNLCGRFFWASISDYIGRRNTYYCFFALGSALYLSIPLVAMLVSANPMVVWLIMFYAITMVVFTMYGGGFATIPAYLSDVFGNLHVGAIHGRLLTAWSVAGIAGPFILTYLRDLSLKRSISQLAEKVDQADFEGKFGAPLASLDELVAAKTVTISKMMDIAPVGVADPTPNLYNITMFVMAGLLAAAFFANFMIRPVAARHHLKSSHPDPD